MCQQHFSQRVFNSMNLFVVNAVNNVQIGKMTEHFIENFSILKKIKEYTYSLKESIHNVKGFYFFSFFHPKAKQYAS